MLGLVEMPAVVGVLFGSYRFCALLGSSWAQGRAIIEERDQELLQRGKGTFLPSVGCAFFGYEIVVMVAEFCNWLILGYKKKSMNQSGLRILP